MRVTPREIGYRSAFVGAVLATLPGVIVESRPLRLRLRMPRARMTGWARDTWEVNIGSQGYPFRHTASNAFRAAGLEPGDAIYVVAQDDGRLLLIGG